VREKINLLIVEDSEPMALAYGEFVKGACEIRYASSLAQAREQLRIWTPQLILLDIQLPDGSGLDLLVEMRSSGSEAGIVVITSESSTELAVVALKEGADDFLEKPFSAERLRTTLRNTVEKRKLRSLVSRYETESGRSEFHGFIGSSLPMQGVYHMVESAAPSKATVFVTGDSGTGKEVLARAIHESSPRSDGPFIALNCGAIPKELMESEIFGHVKGAFTGAQGERKGAALMADGGTLFLDEICEMDLELQVKLLRFLQTEVFRAVGSDHEKHVDVRIVCATNRDPMDEVRQGNFREDLYYRLHVISIELPALRERGSDIMQIARHLLQEYAIEEGKALREFSRDAERSLATHGWPGNVRELQNVIRQIVVLNDGAEVTTKMLPLSLRQRDVQPPAEGAVNAERAETETVQEVVQHPMPDAVLPLWKVEELHIERAIEACDGNIPRAAAMLEVSPSTLYRKLKAAVS
jgi:DNA-binding NtrC family response regulator